MNTLYNEFIYRDDDVMLESYLNLNIIKNYIIVRCDKLENLVPRIGCGENYFQFQNENNKNIVKNLINEIKDYKNIILFSPEEFNYHVESVSYFIDLALENNHKIFICSFSSNVNEFLQIKYPNHYNKNILANSSETLFRGNVIDWTVKYNNPNLVKDINLLFLNYNRKPNRGYIN
jgi:hypothetical protein